MNQNADLLFELGTEELPPKALKRLGQALATSMEQQLLQAALSYQSLVFYATPRRLAVQINALATHQADKNIERRGPAVQAAFDKDGEPTKAALGFAKSCGVQVADLQKTETDKGAWLVWQSKQQGKPTEALLPAMFTDALAALPIPKRMRWGEHKFQFVRPVHWVLCLFNDKVVPGELFGISFGNKSYGHRFHHPNEVAIESVQQYVESLKHANVLVDFEERKQTIRTQVEQLAKQINAQVDWDESLLDEVTGLVEWPRAVLGQFDERFLSVPREALVAAMKGHQRYFPVNDAQGNLMPYFITISNIESLNQETVRKGNERVIRPRLVDAEFFWNSDRKSALITRRERLKQVVFQKQLGSIYDKSARVAMLCQAIAKQLDIETEQAIQAAQLAKCDLLTDMVCEFPELQGIMGRYYALNDGVKKPVAAALEQQYLPRGAGDDLPDSALGQCLALADRLDTLVGLFAIGKHPSGDKDPFALRRAALGVLRILIEKGVDLDLTELLRQTVKSFDETNNVQAAEKPVFKFMMERLRAYYLEREIGPDVIDAVIARQPSKMTDFDLRIKAVQTFKKLPEAESLAAANKRISNILKQAKDSIPKNIDRTQLKEQAEKALADQVDNMAVTLAPMLENRDYEQAMCELAQLKAPVDEFFDHVMVMDENKKLRVNRLALLSQLSELFLRTADLSRLQ